MSVCETVVRVKVLGASEATRTRPPRVVQTWAIPALTGLLLLIATGTARALCVQVTPSQAYAGATAVVEATVLHVGSSDQRGWSRITIATRQHWKRSTVLASWILALNSPERVPFVVGRTYLIFFEASSDGMLTIGKCSPLTAELSAAGGTIKALERIVHSTDVGGTAVGPNMDDEPDPRVVEQRLRRFLTDPDSSTSFSISYSSWHNLWHDGSVTSVVADGTVNEKTGPGGISRKYRVPVSEVGALVNELIVLRAWEQGDLRIAPAGYRQCRLTISADRRSSSIYEWCSDLLKNDRLVRVDQRMERWRRNVDAPTEVQ